MQVYYKKYLLLLFSLMITAFCFGQTRSDLEKQKNRAIRDIEYTNQLLRETEAGKKESYNNLLLINSKISARQQLINSINQEIEMIDVQIDDDKMIIELMQEDLKQLREEYANMIFLAYKNRNSYDRMMFLLSSEDFNQAYRRLKYYQQYSEYRKRQALAIKSTQTVLNSEIEKLELSKIEKENLLDDKRIEANNLKVEKRSQDETIDELSHKEQGLRNKLQQQQETAAQLQREIERIIAEEAKRNSGSTSGAYSLTPAEKIISTNFGKNKGLLPWPVERGVIVSSFGKHPHAVLNNVTIDNAGVDIATSDGAQVRALFEGEVRRVFSLPGAQNAIIIKHGEYMTVYTHVAKTLVQKGDMVSTKQIIGEVYSDKIDNKTIIHVEIWKGSAKQNPAYWLAK